MVYHDPRQASSALLRNSPQPAVTAPELVHQPAQFGNLGVGGAVGGEPSRHAFERRHYSDDLDDLALRFLDDIDAAARPGADKALLFEDGHRLTDRGAADPEILGQPALVEPDFVRMVVNVDRGDRPLQRGIGFLREAGAGVQPRHVELRNGANATFGHGSGIWYTKTLHNRFSAPETGHGEADPLQLTA